MLSNKYKYPFSTFTFTFNHEEDIKKIFELETIKEIKIENIKRSKLIPQCKYCQGYGHTQKCSNLQQNYIKCVRDHCTKQYKEDNLKHPNM